MKVTSKQNVFYVFSMLLIVAIFLSACAPAATPTPITPEQPTTAPADTVAAPTAAMPVELTMWTWKINHVPGLQAVAKDFEAKTGIKVTVTAVNPDDAYRTKLITSAQSGDLPDIMSYWTGGEDFWEKAGSGVLTDITDKVDGQWKSVFIPGTFDKSSVLQQSRFDACQKDPNCLYKNVEVGHAYSVPYFGGSAYMVYASKPLMKQAGLDPNKAPKTAEEWLDMMKAIKEKTGVAALVTGVQNPDVSARWLFNPLLMTSCGQEKYDAIYDGRASFEDPCATKVFNFMYQIAQDNLWTADILATDIGPSEAVMGQGKSGFIVGGTYTLSGILSNGMKAEDVLAFAVPPLKDSALDHLSLGMDAFIEAGITRDSKHPAEALQFLKFLTSADEAAVFAKTVGDVPATKLDADPAKVGGAMAGLVAVLNPADSPFGKSHAEPYIDEIFNVLRPGLQAFITGETTPDKLAADVQAASESGWPKHGGPKQP
jgi:ABC-type glycerol-3-phosphate transport system substrate-binding protein